MRDTQFSKALTAIEAAQASHPESVSIVEAQALADRITRTAWWRKAIPRELKVLLYEGSYGRCEPATRYVTFPVRKGSKKMKGETCWNVDLLANNRYAIMHGLAHILVPEKHDRASHSPEWAGMVVTLTSRYVSSEAAGVLRQAFKDHRVKRYRWSSEAKEKAKERAEERKFAAVGDRLRQLEQSLMEDE